MIDVSIIFPVYKVEAYLKRGVESALHQTHRSIEVILVDDCSPDGSGRLCDELAAMDERIKVIHKQNNEGSGYARNTGLEAAEGEYVYFADPDDWMDVTALEEALPVIRAHQADILVWGYREVLERKNGTMKVGADVLPELEGCFTLTEFWDRFDKLKFAGSPWVRLFRRGYLNEKHLRFTSLRTGQDAYFTADVYGAGFEKIVYMKKAFYNYFGREGSAVNRYNPVRMDCIYTYTNHLKEVLDREPLAKGRYDALVYQQMLYSFSFGIVPLSSTREIGMAEKVKIIGDFAQRPLVAEALEKGNLSGWPRSNRLKMWMLRHRLYRCVILLGALKLKLNKL